MIAMTTTALKSGESTSDQSPPDRIVASYAAAAHAAALVNHQPVSKAAETFLASSVPRSKQLKRSRNQSSRVSAVSSPATSCGPVVSVAERDRRMGWSRVVDRTMKMVEYIAPDGTRLRNQSEVVAYFRSNQSQLAAESRYDELVASCFNFDPSMESVELIDNLSFLTALEPAVRTSGGGLSVPSVAASEAHITESGPVKQPRTSSPSSTNDAVVVTTSVETAGPVETSTQNSTKQNGAHENPSNADQPGPCTSSSGTASSESTSPTVMTSTAPAKMTTETVTIDSLGIPGSVVPSVIPPSLINSSVSPGTSIDGQPSNATCVQATAGQSTSSGPNLDQLILQAQQQQHLAASYAAAALSSKLLMADAHYSHLSTPQSVNPQLMSILLASQAPMFPIQSHPWTDLSSVSSSLIPMQIQAQLPLMAAAVQQQQQHLALASLLQRQSSPLINVASQPSLLNPQVQAYLAALQGHLPSAPP